MATTCIPRNTALQAVIFDMDGVIIDSHTAHRRAWKDFLKTLGRDVSENELDCILTGRKRADILRIFLGELSDEQAQHYGKQKDDFFQRVALDVKPVPGVVEFLDEMQSNRIEAAVATSASRLRTLRTLQRLRLESYFSVVVTGDDVDLGKPDPGIYRLTCRKLGLTPDNVLVFEDAVSGVQAARQAGLRCVGVVGERTPAELLLAAGASRLITSFIGVSLNTLC